MIFFSKRAALKFVARTLKMVRNLYLHMVRHGTQSLFTRGTAWYARPGPQLPMGGIRELVILRGGRVYTALRTTVLSTTTTVRHTTVLHTTVLHTTVLHTTVLHTTTVLDTILLHTLQFCEHIHKTCTLCNIVNTTIYCTQYATMGTQHYTVQTLQHWKHNNTMCTLCIIGNTTIHSAHFATF